MLLDVDGVKMESLSVNQPRRKLELDYNFVSPEPDLDFASDIILPSVTFGSKLFSAGATYTRQLGSTAIFINLKIFKSLKKTSFKL